MNARQQQTINVLLAELKHAASMTEDARLEAYGIQGIDLIIDRLYELGYTGELPR